MFSNTLEKVILKHRIGPNDLWRRDETTNTHKSNKIVDSSFCNHVSSLNRLKDNMYWDYCLHPLGKYREYLLLIDSPCIQCSPGVGQCIGNPQLELWWGRTKPGRTEENNLIINNCVQFVFVVFAVHQLTWGNMKWMSAKSVLTKSFPLAVKSHTFVIAVIHVMLVIKKENLASIPIYFDKNTFSEWAVFITPWPFFKWHNVQSSDCQIVMYWSKDG